MNTDERRLWNSLQGRYTIFTNYLWNFAQLDFKKLISKKIGLNNKNP